MVLEALIQWVKEVAATEVMPRFLRVGSNRKEDGSLFTEADIAAQNAFEQGLKSIANYPMLGEEMAKCDQVALWHNNPEGLWVVDPIDGTTNFINGLPHFALSAALVKNGVSQLGVIFNPYTNELYAAERGQGARMNDTVLPIKRTLNPLSEAIAGVEVKYLRSGKLASRMQTLAPCGSQRSMGSSTLDWCYLASGRYDVYVHGGQKLWDYAAGALIFEEAGGQLATLEGDDFWNGQHVFSRSAIAALQPELFNAWLKWIRNNQ